jgi:hypothetical protein
MDLHLVTRKVISLTVPLEMDRTALYKRYMIVPHSLMVAQMYHFHARVLMQPQFITRNLEHRSSYLSRQYYPGVDASVPDHNRWFIPDLL